MLAHIARSPYKADIKVLGRVSKEQKLELLQKSHVLLVTSIKEGWGLVVTEANSQGTPAVVYNADGLRDSVKNQETGIICDANTPETLAKHTEAILTNPQAYAQMREAAWQWSKEITFDRGYSQFKIVILHEVSD